ncbi:hypothetical protein UFOVP1382_75 [uncultured Caudovirales phage]|uniref:Uncharacterized protein n=1 Tax=uncultured Caudovirales phage TaxID=2100421 RepID=A0A6J5S4F1_9CAUD|nr:hypothetical protein UFOVP1382_75 [uncultured Caudovirales phage]
MSIKPVGVDRMEDLVVRMGDRVMMLRGPLVVKADISRDQSGFGWGPSQDRISVTLELIVSEVDILDGSTLVQKPRAAPTEAPVVDDLAWVAMLDGGRA